jgi:hypothetical protein
MGGGGATHCGHDSTVGNIAKKSAGRFILLKASDLCCRANRFVTCRCVGGVEVYRHVSLGRSEPRPAVWWEGRPPAGGSHCLARRGSLYDG